MDAAIQKANQRIDYLAGDQEALRLYEMREKAILDYNSGINYAVNAAVQDEKIETAKEMLKNKEPVSKITKYTKLDKSIIEELRKEIE
jgi:predicted transposase/invertase (TIGR01784 family)